MTSKKDDGEAKQNKLFIPMLIVVTSGAVIICVLLALIAWRMVELAVFELPDNEELPLYQPIDSDFVEKAGIIYDDFFCHHQLIDDRNRCLL